MIIIYAWFGINGPIRHTTLKHSADERVKQHWEQLVYTQRVGSHAKCYCTLLRVIMRDEWLVVMTCTS